MKIAGIIAEYNPFHNGHAWHIQETRRLTGCDYVVVCMAGHFTQRGEPAILSKWNRVRMALNCGADAVFELPAMFAVRTADAFARGGVSILGGIGMDVLSFGSEKADLGLIERLAQVKQNEPTEVSETVKYNMGKGMPHVRARGEALERYLGLPEGLLNQPNLILATEYAKAVHEQFPDMALCAVRRIGDYNGDDLGEYASASALRRAFAKGEAQAAIEAIPKTARAFATPDAMHPMDDMLMLRLREMPLEALAGLPDVREGLEHRLYRLCREASGREALLEALKCKRYTWARLSRLLTHALLGMTQDEVNDHPMPTYARLIGARRDAGPLLGELDRRATLPIASSAAQLREDACFALECRATDIWSLLHDDASQRLAGREFTEKFVRI